MPSQLVLLLEDTLEKVVAVPIGKKRNAPEEAEWEDEDDEERMQSTPVRS